MSEPFDPEAFIRDAKAQKRAAPKPAEATFDPEAFLREAQAQRQADLRVQATQGGGSVFDSKVGGLEHVANRWSSTLPLGRTLRNLIGTGIVQGAKALGVGNPNVQFTPEALAEAQAQGLPVNEANAIPGVLDTYREIRDRSDARLDAGTAQHPWLDKFATGLGVANAMVLPIPKVLGGGTPASAMANSLRGLAAARRAAGIGAVAGGIQAAGDSRADLTSGEGGEYLQQALETGLGAGIGATTGGVGALAPELARGTGRLMNRWGLGLGRRVIQGGGRSLTNDMPVSDAAVREAMRSGAIVPLGSTTGTYRRLAGLGSEVGAQYEDILRGLETGGTKGPLAEPLAEALERRALEEFATTGADKRIANAFLREAKNIRALADADGYLGLKQAEKIKQNLQGQVNYDTVKEKLLNPARKEIASTVREANEEAVAEAGRMSLDPEVIERAESFVPVKQRLGRILEAREAAKGGAQRTGNRGLLGVVDTQVGQMAGGLGPGLAASLGTRLVRGRLPSAGATGLYWGGEALQGLGNVAEAARDRLLRPASATGARAVTATELEALSEWLAGQRGEAATEAQQTRARVEALRRRSR